jgi:hypothetical protein
MGYKGRFRFAAADSEVKPERMCLSVPGGAICTRAEAKDSLEMFEGGHLMMALPRDVKDTP